MRDVFPIIHLSEVIVISHYWRKRVNNLEEDIGPVEMAVLNTPTPSLFDIQGRVGDKGSVSISMGSAWQWTSLRRISNTCTPKYIGAFYGRWRGRLGDCSVSMSFNKQLSTFGVISRPIKFYYISTSAKYPSGFHLLWFIFHRRFQSKYPS